MRDLSQNGLEETNQEAQNLLRNIDNNVSKVSGQIDNISDKGRRYLPMLLGSLSNFQNQILSMLNTLNQYKAAIVILFVSSWVCLILSIIGHSMSLGHASKILFIIYLILIGICSIILAIIYNLINNNLNIDVLSDPSKIGNVVIGKT